MCGSANSLADRLAKEGASFFSPFFVVCGGARFPSPQVFEEFFPPSVVVTRCQYTELRSFLQLALHF